MKFGSNEDSGFLAAFNFSSLTDIVMLLLIFFLLTSSFVTTKGLDVVVPEAQNTEQHQDLRVVISLDENGRVYFDQDETTKGEIPTLVENALKQDSTAIVVLRANKSLEYASIIEMLDIVKGAGATRFFLATERPDNR